LRGSCVPLAAAITRSVHSVKRSRADSDCSEEQHAKHNKANSGANDCPLAPRRPTITRCWRHYVGDVRSREYENDRYGDSTYRQDNECRFPTHRLTEAGTSRLSGGPLFRRCACVLIAHGENRIPTEKLTSARQIVLPIAGAKG